MPVRAATGEYGDHVTDRHQFGHVVIGGERKIVHARVVDHHPGGINKAIALLLTAKIGNMRCFWVFCGLALLSLPATLHLMNVVGPRWLGLPAFFLSYGFIFADAWLCQNFIQLVLLPALMVGQNLQNDASDVRAAKTFDEVGQILDAVKRIDEYLNPQRHRLRNPSDRLPR